MDEFYWPITRINPKIMLQVEARDTTPQSFWQQFCNDYHSLHEKNPNFIFQRLSKAIEFFRPDEYRRDPFFVKIWLAYLEAHFDLYGDEEEIKRLFRFLKSEHVGTDNVDLYLHYGHFELRTGKPEKCLSILETAIKIPSLSQNDSIRKAMVEFKLIGTFRLEPLVPERFLPPSTPLNNGNILNGPFLSTTKAFLNNSSNHHFPPPTPSSQPFMDFTNKTTPMDIVVDSERRDSIGSVPKISPSEEQSINLSSVTGRIRRLGNLGPPKRTVLSTTPIIETSPNDSTVPKDYPRNDDNSSSQEDFVNSPTRGSRQENLTIDKENMSLTTISPTTIKTTTAQINQQQNDDMTVIKSRAVKVNGKTYKVLQMVGRGGSSKVFKVLSSENNTIYALKKVSLRNLDEITLSGYLNEINLLKSLVESEHIIKLVDYEINKENGNLFMVIEFGETDLGKLLKQNRNRRLDYNFIRYMWEQMLKAVRTVHNAKIVHCDLKPANFLLVCGTLKLIDFGISKAIMNDTTNIVRENQVGTVNYMSPEALQESSSSERGKIKIGRASDVWSLGCILYEMVYGRPPFARFTLIQRLHKILDTNYEIEFTPIEDQSLLEVIKGCLQRQAKKRMTIDELLIHPFLVPQPTPPPTLTDDSVIITRRQIFELMEKFSRHIPQLDAPSLTEKIFLQWRRQTSEQDHHNKG